MEEFLILSLALIVSILGEFAEDFKKFINNPTQTQLSQLETINKIIYCF